MPETRAGQFENAIGSRSADELPQSQVHGRRVGSLSAEAERFLEGFFV